MQVNTHAANAAAIDRMSGLRASIAGLQAQISTGNRIAAPDDDPAGAAHTVQLNRALAINAADQTGIDRATSRLNSVDTALGGVSTLLESVKELALKGATATLGPADRATLAAAVGQLAEQLLSYANTRDSDGNALFGGARTGTAYAADATGTVSWQGAGTAARLTLDSGSIMTSFDGPAVFAGLDGGTTLPAPAVPPAVTPAPVPIVTNVFALLTGLRAALAEPDAVIRAHGMANALTGLDAAIGRTADSRALAGTRLARLTTESTRLDAGKLALETDLSKTDSLDAASAIAQLQQQITVLQAAQLSFVKIGALSLWDLLR